MEVELKANVLKNVLTSLITTHSEVNIVLSSNPIKIQFITSNFDCILYWKIDDALATKVTDNFYRSETVQMDKLLKVLTNDTVYITLYMDSDSESKFLIYEQKCPINNCLSNKAPLEGLYQLFNLKIPYVAKHPEVSDYITDYVQFKQEFNSPSLVSSIFNIKMIEKMINSSLNYTTDIEFSVSNNMMTLSISMLNNLFTSAVLSKRNDDFQIVKKIGIGSLSLLKAYKKISSLISISLVRSATKYALIIKPVTMVVLDTELIIFFN